MAPTPTNSDELQGEELKKAGDELRKKFLEELDKTKTDDYVDADVQKLREDDDLCQRYVTQSQGNIDKAVQCTKESFKWRKEFGVHGVKESSLSEELFKEGGVHPFNHDKEGNPILMFIVKQHKKDAEKTEDQRRFIVYWVEKLLRESPSSKITIIYDCIDSGYSNMDLDMTMFVTNLFIKYYPSSMGYLIVYDMPWLFNAIWKVIKPLLPKQSRDKVKFVNKESVKELIDVKSLPVRMGGEDATLYSYEPTDEAKK